MAAAEGRSIRQLTPEEVEKMRVVCRMGREVRAPTRAGWPAPRNGRVTAE